MTKLVHHRVHSAFLKARVRFRNDIFGFISIRFRVFLSVPFYDFQSTTTSSVWPVSYYAGLKWILRIPHIPRTFRIVLYRGHTGVIDIGKARAHTSHG